ncbi:hypothetical protein F2Q70_00043183 [Brassica cretica]|uniref:Uncharacterized protein n=1 Tax=Brassica cretica TaxID=69181 RepID=A0A8S9KH27_BRACR|nr:hypothetical protein F2Q70_00043183 [Brassica cretica]
MLDSTGLASASRASVGEKYSMKRLLQLPSSRSLPQGPGSCLWVPGPCPQVWVLPPVTGPCPRVWDLPPSSSPSDFSCLKINGNLPFIRSCKMEDMDFGQTSIDEDIGISIDGARAISIDKSTELSVDNAHQTSIDSTPPEAVKYSLTDDANERVVLRKPKELGRKADPVDESPLLAKFWSALQTVSGECSVRSIQVI